MPGKTEEPSYTVLQKLEDGVEIREYCAQIRAKSPMRQENRAFGVLAEYIFGENDRHEKIGMTAPVVTSRDEMAFIMPGRYSLANLPMPMNTQIRIDREPPEKIAVLRFSGFTSPSKNEKEINKLLEVLKSHGIKTEGEPFLMRYNPPWTLPFLRRNEVAVKVKL
ncbi:MAG: heme-binding protein [Methanotrichaceae archaeon]|jgi:hypothetical protein|nr:heme-binding protein [Methanotrichaceae archaeon]